MPKNTFNSANKCNFKFIFRIRLPGDRDPRQGNAPLFGVLVAPHGNTVGVIKIGDAVMVSE